MWIFNGKHIFEGDSDPLHPDRVSWHGLIQPRMRKIIHLQWVGFELWLLSRTLPGIDCLLFKLRFLHTGRGQEGAPDLDPFKDLISIEWPERALTPMDPSRSFYLSVVGIGRTWAILSLSALYLVGAVHGWRRARSAPSRTLRDGAMYGTILAFAGWRHVKGNCAWWASSQPLRVGIVPTLHLWVSVILARRHPDLSRMMLCFVGATLPSQE